MKLSSRKELLNAADIELFNIRETIRLKSTLIEDFETDRQIRDFETRIQKLKIRAKEYEKEMNFETNDPEEVMNEFKKKKSKKRHANPIGGKPEDESWKDKPVTSKYALANLPPTDDPEELEKRRRMEVWQKVNKELIDGWSNYIFARSWSEDYWFSHRTKPPTVYHKNGKPIMSNIYKNQIMTVDEWMVNQERKERKARGELGNFITDLLKDLAFWMSP